MKETTSRRDLIKGLTLSSLAALPLTKLWGQTPPQTEGPFRPIGMDNDLIHVSRNPAEVAKGSVILLEGQVVDTNDQPIPDALVEIWQTDDNGKYNHPSDQISSALDPNFQYWGRDVTNSSGLFRFQTIKPKPYPAGGSWTRPAHIHFKIMRRGFKDLTTQMYFKAENATEQQLLDKDLVILNIAAKDRDKVIVEFTRDPAVTGRKKGFFKIELDSVTSP